MKDRGVVRLESSEREHEWKHHLEQAHGNRAVGIANPERSTKYERGGDEDVENEAPASDTPDDGFRDAGSIKDEWQEAKRDSHEARLEKKGDSAEFDTTPGAPRTLSHNGSDAREPGDCDPDFDR